MEPAAWQRDNQPKPHAEIVAEIPAMGPLPGSGITYLYPLPQNREQEPQWSPLLGSGITDIPLVVTATALATAMEPAAWQRDNP